MTSQIGLIGLGVMVMPTVSVVLTQFVCNATGSKLGHEHRRERLSHFGVQPHGEQGLLYLAPCICCSSCFLVLLAWCFCTNSSFQHTSLSIIIPMFTRSLPSSLKVDETMKIAKEQK